jgi:hypothetical protein
MTWDSSMNVFELVAVPTLPPNRCAVCGTQSGTDGPYGQAVTIRTVDGAPAVCRRCMVGIFQLWAVVPAQHFAEVAAERDEARELYADAAAVRDEAVRSVDLLEAEVAAKTQEVRDMQGLIRERDAQIKAAREGRLDIPDVASIVEQVKEALLEQPRPDVRAKAARKPVAEAA